MKFILVSIFMVFFVAANAQHSNSAFFNADLDSYIDLGIAAELTNYDLLADSNQMTITLWAKWGDKTKTGSWANLITAADSSGSGDVGVWWVQHNSSNTKFEFALSTSGRSLIQSTTNPTEGTWYHIACVYDGANMRLYVNGTEEAHTSKTGNIESFHSNTKLNFGRWANSGDGYRKFDGYIDELSIWNKALTPTQIDSIKRNPESVTGVEYDSTGILGYWNFDDKTATDLTANGNNGVVGGGTTLPVELLNFEANYFDYNINLNWQTASELNNDYFLVERTSDQSLDHANWVEAGRVTGAGTTNTLKDYKFIDDAINTNNEVIYYRLKQVDYDGKFTNSNIVSVSLKDNKEIKVFPNPSTGLFKIHGLSDNVITTVEVYNSLGQVVSSYEGVNDITVDISE